MKNQLQQNIKLSNISPRQMVNIFNSNPPVLAKDIIEKHYIGLWIKTSGVIKSIDVLDDYITLNFDDKDNVYMSVNFRKPVSEEITLLNKGDKVSLIGKVFNVGEGIVVLDNCQLIQENRKDDYANNQKREYKKWWENSFWQIIMISGAIAGIIGLIIYLLYAK